jgi:phospholipase C
MRRPVELALMLCASLLFACKSSTSKLQDSGTTTSDGGTGSRDASPGIDAASSGDASISQDGGTTASAKVQHILIIMQENRSFDHYFGTYPGAEGIPVDARGVPTVCNPDPVTSTCVKPFHLTADKNVGGPHQASSFRTCVDGGRMDGFIRNAESGTRNCADPNNPMCTNGTLIDVMGYHTAAEIPNYWSYAQHFVLNDHMFQQNASWSYPMHLYLVSGWSATCTVANDPKTCHTNINNPQGGPPNPKPWTDLTYLLHQAGVSWKYYLSQGSDPHCGNDPEDCDPVSMLPTVPSIWNPLVSFDTVKANNELGNIVPYDQFYQDVASGNLPNVAWFAPASEVSEHPVALVSRGQAYVTALINTIMKSPFWSSTVIFLSWDDWGGFYDHLVPPKVDAGGYGLRVPGLVISPWVKQAGMIDKQVLSHDAYIKFIEDVFLQGKRIDPMTDGRPDSRPTVRENILPGDLMNDFDFTRQPLAPLILTVTST